MADRITGFYDSLADHYHLIFDDWNRAIERQGRILNPLLLAEVQGPSLKVLDCACGIGTQALGLAALGHRVVASDLSRVAVERAKHEAASRGLNISFHVSDMTYLTEVEDSSFDIVVALDNALPHLTSDQLILAMRAAHSKLKPGGTFIASIRDYDTLILQRPTIQAPAFYGQNGGRRIVHQVWDWVDHASYVLHLYITMQAQQEWTTHHFVSQYRCLLREELSNVLRSSAFRQVRWVMPPESGFYQPLVVAKRPL
jgi:glycine/sarcosine N-methyltransferase